MESSSRSWRGLAPAGAPVARFVEREIRAYLECGISRTGSSGSIVMDVDATAWSPSRAKAAASARPAAVAAWPDTAAHLVDRVLPEVPIRQWVLTLPYPLPVSLAWNAKLTTEVLRCFLRSTFADQRRRARALCGIRRGQCGSVTFIQRFGSALNLAPHFHTSCWMASIRVLRIARATSWPCRLRRPRTSRAYWRGLPSGSGNGSSEPGRGMTPIRLRRTIP
ncbi:MAG: transposase [Deltaproteobacteria bacterium]|nr:transposase [Deltaproteobacteria bacterium]